VNGTSDQTLSVLANMPWLRWLVTGLSLQGLGFTPGSVHVAFVVDRLALGQVFFSYLVLPC
jgi:hypothetical protein